MYKITIGVDGMACGMCEAHINNAIRNEFSVKKVTSSHAKKKTEIISETELDEKRVISIIENTGYKVTDYNSEPYEKKGFSLFRK